MSGEQNWRTQINAGDYFGHQQKQTGINSRQPLIRKPSDLVGPGIAATAVRLTDFNDLLATYNGFYSATGEAENAPSADPDDRFVGWVSADAEFGGIQIFTRLGDGVEFRRVFTRAPYDAASISWGTWV